MTATLNTIEKGLAAEQHACDYLIAQGLHLVERNYRCTLGEIDLILRDQDTLVFIEVRLRNNTDFGSAIDSVTQQKQKKLIKTARHYLCRHNLYDKLNCRFDIIGLCYAKPKTSLEWIKDAFSADYF